MSGIFRKVSMNMKKDLIRNGPYVSGPVAMLVHPRVTLPPSHLQGLPRTYNKDLQEDKEPLFDTVATVHDCLRIAAGVVATMTPNGDKLRAQLVPEMLATDLADYLVRKVSERAVILMNLRWVSFVGM